MTDAAMNHHRLQPLPDRRLPSPRGHQPFGHLPRWMHDSLSLLEDGARMAPLFQLRLWRTAVVGYTPDWNRFVLGDMDGFRSKGSLSQLSPYLSAGVVATDAPLHRPRRKLLNPTFHRASIVPTYAGQLKQAAEEYLPIGEFELNEWCSTIIQRYLNIVFFGGTFPSEVLQHFLAPLDRPMPFPLLPRPFRLRLMQKHLAEALSDPIAGSLAALFADVEDGVAELRVAIAAAYDTTAHTLAFALWELAARPELLGEAHATNVISETLRLYPAGWIGSRVCLQDTEFDGLQIRAGQLVLYSPYLTHRDEQHWDDPTQFRPDRFDGPLPAWSYIPYSAGERTCLGAALATLMLQTTVSAFADANLRRVSGNAHPLGGLTLTPGDKIRLTRVA